jgi:hypothetical protein
MTTPLVSSMLTSLYDYNVKTPIRTVSAIFTYSADRRKNALTRYMWDYYGRNSLLMASFALLPAPFPDSADIRFFTAIIMIIYPKFPG